MQGVILAAGDGTRLAPFTLTHPKPLVRVLGRPLLDYTMDAFVAAGIRDLVLIVGYKEEQIRRWVGDGSRYSAGVIYVSNPDYGLENATSLYAARAAVAGHAFVLAMADHMISADILRTLLARDAPGDTLCIDRCAHRAPQLNDATRVWVDSRGYIRRIGKGLTGWNAVDTGVFLFTSAIFDAIDAVRASGNWNPNISQSVTWLIEHGSGLRACDVSGAWWTDVDTFEDLQNVEAELSSWAEQPCEVSDGRRLGVALHQSPFLAPVGGLACAYACDAESGDSREFCSGFGSGGSI
jgi:choline kinase